VSAAGFGSAPVLRSELLAAGREVARQVLAQHAADVDAQARFPQESIDALRKARLLGCAVPEALGGQAASLPELSALCMGLAEQCASTAMVFAMHQIQLLCILRHADEQPFWQRYLAECAERQLLIASATSEIGVGGDIRSSVCALERDGARFEVTKQASVISYGEHTDDILVTARRAPDARSAASGTRSACAAPAAWASCCAPRPRSSRSCPRRSR
jgi:acyl-CoA dehydrogenase